MLSRAERSAFIPVEAGSMRAEGVCVIDEDQDYMKTFSIVVFVYFAHLQVASEASCTSLYTLCCTSITGTLENS